MPAPGPALQQPAAQAPARQVDHTTAQVSRGRPRIADVPPAAPCPDKRLLGEFLSQGPVISQPKGQPHKLGVMALIQQRQCLTARRAIHASKIPRPRGRLPPKPAFLARHSPHPRSPSPRARDDGKRVTAGHQSSGRKTTPAGSPRPGAIAEHTRRDEALLTERVALAQAHGRNWIRIGRRAGRLQAGRLPAVRRQGRRATA
jgi:hypothetical protein